jgi:hypothetical protein
MNTTTDRDDVAYREQCLRAAELLLLIRDEWRDGDDLHTQWAAKGWSTIGDSFLHAQRQARYEIHRLIGKLRRDIGLGIGRRLPSGCSERLFTLAAKLRPYEQTPEGDLRYTLRWNDLGVDDEVEALVFMLAAQGESAPANAASQTESGGDAKKPDAVGQKKRMSKGERDRLIRQIKRSDPTISGRAIAKRIGCSPETVTKSEVFKQYEVIRAAGDDPGQLAEDLTADLATENELLRDYGPAIYANRPK